MPKRHTTATAIRKYRSDYKRLHAFEARLTYSLFLMKKRLIKMAEDESTWQARKIQLATHLSNLTQLQSELQIQSMPAKARNAKLKKIEKEVTEVRVHYARNEYHLAVLEKRKYKDNAAKLVLKEAKRDEVVAQTNAAKTSWERFEQIQLWENADFEAFKALHEAKTDQIETNTTTLDIIQSDRVVMTQDSGLLFETFPRVNMSPDTTRNQKTTLLYTVLPCGSVKMRNKAIFSKSKPASELTRR